MRETLQALLTLQEIDRDIFRVKEELKRLPLELKSKRVELDKRIGKMNDLQAETKRLRVRIKELEDQTTVQRQRVRKIETEAGNSRADMALLVAYQHEIRTLKREISGSEEDGLQCLERVEDLGKQISAFQTELDAEQKLFDEFSKNVETEVKDATARRDQLSAERARRMSSEIPPEALATYNRLLSARSGVAMAELSGRICQGCYMEMPTNLCVRVARGTELVQCPSCDRILYPAP
jgi:predicted  nucleic acid-binding Zn-ribbon protein